MTAHPIRFITKSLRLVGFVVVFEATEDNHLLGLDHLKDQYQVTKLSTKSILKNVAQWLVVVGIVKNLFHLLS